MDRASLDALETRVAALRKRAADRAVAAHAAKRSHPLDSFVARFALVVTVLAALSIGAELATWFPSANACRAIPIHGVATITLSTTFCARCTQLDTVTLDTDGNMTHHNDVTGDRRSKVSAADVRALVEEMATSCFFDMLPSYAPAVTSGPVTTMTLTLDGRTKTVRDDHGTGGFEGAPMRAGACMPPAALWGIEWRAEELAGEHDPPAPRPACQTLLQLAHTSCERAKDQGVECLGADENPTCVRNAWAVVRSESGGYAIAHVDVNGEVRRVPVEGRPILDDGAAGLRVFVRRGAGPEDPWGDRITAATDTCLLRDFPTPKLLCVRSEIPTAPPWLPAMLQVPAGSDEVLASHWLDGDTTRTERDAMVEALPLELRDANGVTEVLAGPRIHAAGPPYDFGSRADTARDRAECKMLSPLPREVHERIWRAAVCERLEGQSVASIVAAWRARCAGPRKAERARACTDAVIAVVETNLALVKPWSAP